MSINKLNERKYMPKMSKIQCSQLPQTYILFAFKQTKYLKLKERFEGWDSKTEACI